MTLPQSVTVTWTADGLVIEPNSSPITPPTPGTGVQAKRIADLIEAFGVNTFSSLDEHNIWGSWPADYQPASVIAALRYIVGDTGFALRVREYHYAGRYEMQSQWLPQIVAAFPGTRVAICPGANANVSDVSTMFALASDPATGIAWIEGLNSRTRTLVAARFRSRRRWAFSVPVGPGRRAIWSSWVRPSSPVCRIPRLDHRLLRRIYG